MNYKNILITVTGMSPAIITETVYSLARESPIMIPDKIIAITTTSGKACIVKELFESNVWSQMLKDLKVPKDKCAFSRASHFLRVLLSSGKSEDAEDIITTKDNHIAADCILGTLREFTENPDTRVIFSIAGGRKTMSVLGALSMTLLGRSQDRLCHVLVKPPFDSPAMAPRFYYPNTRVKKYSMPDGKTYSVQPSDITLCDIPFPRNRDLFPEKYSRLPGGFMDTVNLINKILPSAQSYSELFLDPKNCLCKINDKIIKLSIPEFTLYWMLAVRAKNTAAVIRGEKQLHEEIMKFAATVKPDLMPELVYGKNRFKDEKTYDPELFKKAISAIKGKILKNIPYSEGQSLYLPSPSRGVYGLTAAPENIKCPNPS